VQLVSKIFNLCGHDPPTSQTDRQTNDMRSQDRALRYSASRGKNAVRRCVSVSVIWPYAAHRSNGKMMSDGCHYRNISIQQQR